MQSFLRAALWLTLLAAGLAGVSPASAQQTESRIQGRILDQSGAALPGVTVTVTSKDTGAERVEVSDGEGSFTVTNLGPGTYAVTANLDGFQPISRDVVLGLGQIFSQTLSLGVAAVAETVQVSAEAPVIDTSSARIGVNVSPVEVEQLPVNGRNFANLMTLATGATSDGNGGWSSVRFNGKSNQQNYLNYDGVDGTYVWDASPGYLSATGSQFRLQTSMESVAEFRVNSGLAPAESGLGSGGNITVVSKSGSNRFRGSLFEYRRDDALDTASKYDDVKQKLELDQFGGSIGGPIMRNRTFFFASYEGLRQTTGLAFTEAVPSAEARRRILAGEPVGLGGRAEPGSHPRRRSSARRVPRGHSGDVEPARRPHVAGQRGRAAGGHRRDPPRPPVLEQLLGLRPLHVQQRRGRYARPHGDAAAGARQADAEEPVANFQNIFGANLVNEFKVGWNAPETSALAFGPAGYDPTGVSLSGNFTSSSIDARGTTGIARSGLLIRATSASTTVGSAFDPMSLAFSNATTWNARCPHREVRR